MIEEFQNRINKEIDNLSSELAIPPTELYIPIRYMLSLGGKRIRPLFVLMGCDLFGGKTEEAIAPALALELFHNFTLVHDDIIDNAPLRRNQPTVHSKWNRNIAILSGDVMLVKSHQLIGRSKLPPQILAGVLASFNDMAVKVCEGQQWDSNYEQADKISIPQYFKMIELKTAALFASCLKIGALIGGAKEGDANHLFEFGKNTGMAFQIQDDLLDVYGDEEKFGKQKGGDIIANKKTFLLLKAIELSALNSYKKEELAQWISFHPKNEIESKEKVEAVKGIYDSTNVKKITEQEIISYHTKAASLLQTVNANEGKKKALISFTSALLHRET